MASHQHEPNANELWPYFQNVIAWVKATFTDLPQGDEGHRVGRALQRVQGRSCDPTKLEEQVATLMSDDDVTTKKGIYAYVLTGEEKHLSIRQFTDSAEARGLRAAEGPVRQ